VELLNPFFVSRQSEAREEFSCLDLNSHHCSFAVHVLRYVEQLGGIMVGGSEEPMVGGVDIWVGALLELSNSRAEVLTVLVL
jgi:hypothetical protein